MPRSSRSRSLAWRSLASLPLASLALLGAAPAHAGHGGSIIGGAEVASSAYPSVVALENSPGNWFCTGTLIDPSWVLTAAHCVEGETPASLKIRFGDTDVNDTSGGTEVAVAAIHANPGYDGVAWDNDVAVIQLATPVTDVAPTPIHRTAPAFGSTVTQVGYGDADDAGNGAGLLRKVDVTSIDCTTIGDAGITNANLLCFDERVGRGTCYGDSGGPTFITAGGRLEVAGITSGGTADLCTGGFDLETSVPGELAFIDMYVPVAMSPGVDAGVDGGGDDASGCCSTGAGHPGGAAVLAAGALGALLRRRRR